jgi:hypothetical protein
MPTKAQQTPGTMYRSPSYTNILVEGAQDKIGEGDAQRRVNEVDIGDGQNGPKQDVGSGDPHGNYKGECEAQAPSPWIGPVSTCAPRPLPWGTLL